MEGNQPDWFKRKFVNPRNAEGKPQTEKLEYAREFFGALGRKDPRFSGVAMIGSTMKGYGHEKSSDIDVALFYSEKPTRELRKGVEVFGTPGPLGWVDTYTFMSDFRKFAEKFELKKKKEGKKTFDIDIDPGGANLRDLFKINLF